MIRVIVVSAVLVASVLFVSSPATGLAANECTLATPAATPVAAEPERISIGEDEALIWRGGPRAVLLVHGAIYDAESWSPQAEVFSEQGYTVLSLERISSDAVSAGIDYLSQECAVDGITIVGASAGVGGSINAASETEANIDGLIVLAGSGNVSELGDYPKLFVASEGEGMADTMEQLAEDAPGEANSVLILPGSAHAQAVFLSEQNDALVEAMLEFLELTQAEAQR